MIFPNQSFQCLFSQHRGSDLKKQLKKIKGRIFIKADHSDLYIKTTFNESNQQKLCKICFLKILFEFVMA